MLMDNTINTRESILKTMEYAITLSTCDLLPQSIGALSLTRQSRYNLNATVTMSRDAR